MNWLAVRFILVPAGQMSVCVSMIRSWNTMQSIQKALLILHGFVGNFRIATAPDVQLLLNG